MLECDMLLLPLHLHCFYDRINVPINQLNADYIALLMRTDKVLQRTQALTRFSCLGFI